MLNIDAFAFCRDGERRDGVLGFAELTRLRSECVSGHGEVAWTLMGSSHISGHPAMHLTINGSVQLLCQRCLASLVFQIHSESTILLAKGEDAADEIESTLEGDDIEVVAGSKAFDIVALIEDEALLAIPLSPKHEVCPVEMTFESERPDAFAIAKKESPFAGLKDQIMFGKAAGKTKKLIRY